MREEVLASWGSVNKHIKKLNTEEELREYLIYEVTHKNREAVVKRLHQKFNKLRVKRERFEFTMGLTTSIKENNGS